MKCYDFLFSEVFKTILFAFCTCIFNVCVCVCIGGSQPGSKAGSRPSSRPSSRPQSRQGSKPPSRHGSSLSLDSTGKWVMFSCSEVVIVNSEGNKENYNYDKVTVCCATHTVITA